MGIIQRFGDIMEANIGAAFDREQNPDRMIEEYIRELDKDLAEVKQETAAVMAREQGLKTKAANLDKELEKMNTYIERAVKLGHDEDAKVLEAEKIRLENERAEVMVSIEEAEKNSAQIRSMYEKLKSDAEFCKGQKDTLKGKFQTAQSMQKLNDIDASNPDSAMYKINAMEARADRILAQADEDAKAYRQEAEVHALKKKYDTKSIEDIDAELESIKKNLADDKSTGETSSEADVETAETVTDEPTDTAADIEPTDEAAGKNE